MQYALFKLFTINGVKINALGNLKMAQNAILLNKGETRLNNWANRFGKQNNNFTRASHFFSKFCFSVSVQLRREMTKF